MRYHVSTMCTQSAFLTLAYDMHKDVWIHTCASYIQILVSVKHNGMIHTRIHKPVFFSVLIHSLSPSLWSQRDEFATLAFPFGIGSMMNEERSNQWSFSHPAKKSAQNNTICIHQSRLTTCFFMPCCWMSGSLRPFLQCGSSKKGTYFIYQKLPHTWIQLLMMEY